MAKVSVIIPVYNTEKYLKQCLDSAVNQTLKDIEIICINDGSSDNSLEILKEYENKDTRITVISQDNNGQSAARNAGIKMAKGKYIYFMDSDDYLELSALEECVSISEKNDLDILIFKLINFNDGEDEKYTSSYYEMTFLKQYSNKIFNYADLGDASLNIAVSPPGKLFKKELISEIKFIEGLIFEDNLFFAEAMLNAQRVLFFDKHLYNRRIRNDSTTRSGNIKFADSIIIINHIISLAKKYDVYEDFQYGLAKKKIDSAYFRYSLVDEEFKEEFFNKVKNDFNNHQDEYEPEILKNIDLTNANIFKNVISSDNHEEFDLKMDIFNLKMENEKIKKDNKKLKRKIKKLKKENNN